MYYYSSIIVQISWGATDEDDPESNRIRENSTIWCVHVHPKTQGTKEHEDQYKVRIVIGAFVERVRADSSSHQ